MTGPAAGWFADPHDVSRLRYWSGEEWTEHRAPAVALQKAPSYGAPVPGTNGPGATAPYAVASLVLGLLSLFCFGALLGIPAIITGHKAKRAVDASNGLLEGRGLAQAGFVTGIISTAWSALVVVFFVGTFVIGGAVQSSYSDTCTTLITDSSQLQDNPECR